MAKILVGFPVCLSLLSCSLILNKMPADVEEEGDVDTDGDVNADADVETDDGTEGGAECGNAVVEEGEECDDGNDTDGDGCERDCTYTCTDNADCRDESMCNGVETCSPDTHACEPGAALDNGTVCAASPRSICIDGECGISTCGDGIVDSGGGEFCEPPSEGDCNAECILLCDGDEDCPDDGAICNGDEVCLLDTGECTHIYGLDDGAECGSDPRRVCIAQTCQQSVCGDGYADGLLVPAEECDDANGTEGDGCENDCTFSCRINSDCDDGRPCTDDRCDIIHHTCQALITADPGHVCRPAAGPCDVLELCDGESADCPADVFEGSPLVCRAAAGLCDIEERCDGTGPQCPSDVFRPDTFVCRVSTSGCDLAEYCSGVSSTCPADESDCECTGPGDCPDDGIFCNGEEACLPATLKCGRIDIPANGTECDSSPRRICIDESCQESLCLDGFADTGGGEECDDGNEVDGDGCETNCTFSCHFDYDCDDGHDCSDDICNGSTHVCENPPLPPTVTCRFSEGVCDVAELCDGSSLDCPADAFEPRGTLCDWASTSCRGDAFCTGDSPECPEQPVICWNSVDGGDYHSCGIKQDQNLFCWGANGMGQLGTGMTWGSNVPARVSLDTTWVDATAGGMHSCAINVETKLYCWGANGSGQLGDGTNDLERDPTQVAGSIEAGWSDVCAGYVHSCGIASGAAYCWGSNGEGQLGIGSDDESFNTPQEVITETGIDGDWVQISCGYHHTCAVTSVGEAYCWGANASGQLGDSTTMTRYRPTLVRRPADPPPWSVVTCGDNHTCGLAAGEALCWGENEYYQIGDGTKTDRTSPTPPDFALLPDSLKLSAAAGGLHSCVTGDNREGYCWGSNSYGQLGIGNKDIKSRPTKIIDTNWKAVAAGKHHTCAIKFSPSTLWCWGRNSSGQLGDGTTSEKTNPTQVLY